MAVVLLVVGANVVVDVIGVATKENIFSSFGNLPKIRRISKFFKVGAFKLKMKERVSY